ncbi:MAG: nucleotidyltransferase family protein [Pseudomonadota bacterium]
MPEGADLQLEDVRVANDARQASIAAALGRVARRSRTDGFAWLALGGQPRAALLYGDPGLREASGIDLLVPPGQSESIAAVLERSGGFEIVARFRPDGALGRAGLRADARLTLADRATGERIDLHERLFFASGTIGALLGDAFRPSVSRDDDDVPAPPLGAALALDLLLRGNARRWAKRKWLLDLAALIQRLDAAAQAEWLDAIERAGVAPAAAASFSACRDSTGAALPPAIQAWLDRNGTAPEVALRRALYSEALARPERAPPAVRSTPPSLVRRAIGKARRLFATLTRRPLQYTADPATRTDRYPLAFAFARDRLGDSEAPRILSFGCSTGEEVATLRHYFPAATIKGIDVDSRRIAAARANFADSRIAFEATGTAQREPDGFYDAIFCMAVFRDPALDLPETRRADGAITFAAFDREIAELARCLKPGGLLFVEHANFRVADTAAAGHFETVLHSDPPRSGLSPGLYGPDGARLTATENRALGYAKRWSE